MNRRWFGALTALALVLSLPWDGAAAQGTTTGAVLGRVVDNSGAPVSGAVLLLTNTATGLRFSGVSREDGRFSIENVAVGGPYTLSARRIGQQPAEVTNITVALGQAVSVTVTMQPAAAQLAPITVEATRENPLTSVSRTGAASFVSDTQVARLPTLNRNFTDFIQTSPLVGRGTSIGGQHNRLNNVQIDGASDNDLFGLGSSGQPGGQVDAKSITLEAIKEYQVLVAPFDVRQGGFTGGVINAITKSGTNTFHGSGFWYWQSDRLVGADTAGNRFGDYLQNQRGISLSGPIIRDRLHFFVAGEWQARKAPNGGVTIGRDAPTVVGIAADSAQRLATVVRDTFGQNPGAFGPVTIPTPDKNFFGRLDWQLGDHHVLTLRDNLVNASNENLTHSTTSYRFTSNAYTIKNKTNSAVAELHSTLGGGRFYNEARVSWLRIRDARDPSVAYPEIVINNNSTIGSNTVFNRLIVGAERFSQANRLDQDQVELEDNVSFSKGAHRVTVGTHNEAIHFRNIFFPSSTGQWIFPSIAAFEAGTPSQFTRSIPYSDAAAGVPGNLAKGVPVADWGVRQVGAYIQDQWKINDRLTLTGGFRFDVPLLGDKPAYNGAADSAFGIRTDRVPSGNILWAPRLGWNWDVSGDRTTVVRGGAGVFSGHPAYVWLSNAYTNTGRETLNLFCSGASLPTFTIDPQSQPSSCVGGAGVSAPTAVVNYFPDWFHFPQDFKVDAAVDRALPYGLLGTLEVLYTHAIYTIQLQEANLRGVQGHAKDGRPMYGTISPTGTVTPARISPAFGQVLRHTNGDKDYSYSITAQVQKQFATRYSLNAAYTYSVAKDISSVGSSIATSNFGFNPIGGNPNDPPVATSFYSIPHKIVISGTVDLPRNSTLTLLYVGRSGSPYTWTYDGDVNADGYPASNIFGRNNDIVYVPQNASDFLGQSPSDFARLDSLIRSEACLRDHRGQILPRNSCRNPWVNRLDAKFTHSVQAYQGHHVTLQVDAFNLLNMLNKDWGLTKQVSFFETTNLLRLRGWDSATNQGIYQYVGPGVASKQSVDNLASRWRLQVALRYDF